MTSTLVLGRAWNSLVTRSLAPLDAEASKSSCSFESLSLVHDGAIYCDIELAP